MNLLQNLTHRLFPHLHPRTKASRRHKPSPLHHAILESLEPRVLLTTTLYWQGGSGTWDHTATNRWNTAPDGSGTFVTWADGDIADFSQFTGSSVTLATNVSADSIQDGYGFQLNSTATLTLTGDDSDLDGMDVYGGQLVNDGTTTIGEAYIDSLTNNAYLTLAGNLGGVSIVNTGILYCSGPAEIDGAIDNAGTLIIGTEGQNFTFTRAITNHTGATFDWTGGYLALDTVYNSGTLILNGIDTFTGDIEGPATWNSGELDYTTISGSLTINGGVNSLIANNDNLTGSVTWSSGDLNLMDSTTNLTGTNTLDGGSYTLTADGGTFTSTSDINWTSGNLTFQDSAALNINDGTLTLDGGSNAFIIDATSAITISDPGSATWTGGDVTINGTFNQSGTSFTLDGGSNTWTVEDGTLNSTTATTWNSGNLIFQYNATFIVDSGTLNLDGGDQTLTFSGAYLNLAGTIDWTSGNVTIQGYTEVDETMLLTVPTSSTLTIAADTINASSISIDNYGTTYWAPDTSDILTITNHNLLYWQSTNTTNLMYVTNPGYIILDGSTPLIDLSGSGSATEGSPYTLTLGTVSSDIPESITDYLVDWGDNTGLDDFTALGAVTHTYAGTSTATTSYSIQVHLLTADGAYINTAQATVSVADIAPIITPDDPGTTDTTPTLTGSAGITPGDSSTVTLNLYTGSSLTGSPLTTQTLDVDPDTGQFSYSIDPASPLAAGTYTFQTTQSETAGNTGTSAPITFTVTLQSPAAPTNFTTTAISATEIDATWDPAPANDFITAYSLYLSTDYGQTFSHYADLASTATSEAFTGLSTLTPYVFEIIATNATSDSPNQISPATWTQSGIAAPTDLAYTLIDGGLNGINLTWTNNSTAQTAYQVEAKWAGTGQFVEIANLAASATSYTYTDQAGDSTINWATEGITFRVRAVGDGISAYSADPDYVTATATFPDTGSVTDLTLTYTDATGVHFTFAQSGISSYKILYRKQGATPGDYGAWIQDLETPIENPEDPSSNPNGRISLNYLDWTGGIQIAVQADEFSSSGPITNVVTATLPNIGLDAPVLTATIDSVDNQFDFGWTTAGGTEEHPVTYTLLDMTQASDSTSLPGRALASTADLSTVISIPTNGGYFAILATDDLGDISMSNTVNLSTPITPTGLTAHVIDSNSIGLAWDNNNFDETGYTLERSTSPTDFDSDHGLQTFTLDPDQTSFTDSATTDTTLASNITYYIRVKPTDTADSNYTTPVSVTTAPPTIRITMDGLDHSDNLTTGGFVLLNADDDNGSPTVLDLDATHLGKDDLDLKKVTINLTGAKIGDQVAIEWVDNETGFGPGSGSIALWQDQRKNNSLASVVTIDATNQSQIVFYVEGNVLSRTPNDVTITATIENSDGTPYQLDGDDVNDELNLTVGPILVTMSITNGLPAANPTYIGRPAEGPPQIGYVPGGYINAKIQKIPGMDTSGLGIIQTVQISNNIIFDDQVAGAATSPIGSMLIGNTSLQTWDFNSPYSLSTLLDALAVADPNAAATFPFYNLPGVVWNQDVYWIFNKDQPLVYVNAVSPPIGDQTLIDVTYNFTDYVVFQTNDANKNIIVLGEDTWSVRFQGTLTNKGVVKFVPGPDDAATFGTYTPTDAPIPIPLTRPVANDAGASWF